MPNPEFSSGRQYEDSRESREGVSSFKMKLDLSRNVAFNNLSCIRCHT